MKHLAHLAGRVFNTPLAISPDKAAVIAAVLSAKIGGQTLEAATNEYSGDGDKPELEISDNGIAQINICGTLVEKSSWLDAASGLLSYGAITQQLTAAESDARVKGVLLVFDSPGGEVTGMFEAADAVAKFSKPIVSGVNFLACSAAYLLASQTDKIFVSASSVTGSIGVIAQHMETSAWDAAVGIKFTTIYAGARKNDGNPHEPLSTGAKAAIKADVDAVMDQFVTYVANGRGVKEEAIRSTEAGLFRGDSAIGAGLADEVGSPSDALTALIQALPNTSSVASATRLTKKELRMQSKILADPKLAAVTAMEEEPEVDKKETTKAKQPKKAGDGEEEVPEEDNMLSGAACQEIATLCAIAGKPALAATLISSQVPVAKVRERLIAEAADSSAPIHSAIDPSIGAQRASINPNDPKQNPVLADAKRRADAAKGAR